MARLLKNVNLHQYILIKQERVLNKEDLHTNIISLTLPEK